MKIQEKKLWHVPLGPSLESTYDHQLFQGNEEKGEPFTIRKPVSPIPISCHPPIPHWPIPLSPHSPISPSPKTLNNNALIYLFCYSDRWSKIFPSSKTGRKAQIQHKHKLRSINPSIPRSWPLVSKPFDQRTRHNLTLFICPNE